MMDKIYRFGPTLLLAVFISLGPTHHAHAERVGWKKGLFVSFAKDKDLKEVLREFAASQGLMVVVSDGVKGTVNGQFRLRPESFIEMMAASFGFVWHTEGSVLYITTSDDVRSEVIRLSNGDNVKKFKQMIERLNIVDDRFPVTYDNNLNTAILSGPNRYVDLMLKLARSAELDVDVNSLGSQAVSEIRVFPLRFAWAGDIVYSQGNGSQTIPGVATILSDLYSGSSGQGDLTSFAATRRSATPVDQLRKLESNSREGSAQRGGLTGVSPETNPSNPNVQPLGGAGGLPKFRADGRMNAVVVRDIPERMKSHEEAVRALDVKPGLIEIEVRVIEVNTEEVESLGIDWRLRSNVVDIQLGNRNLPTLSWATALSDAAPSEGPNGAVTFSPSPAGVLTTVLGDAGKFLIARINALAQEGRANMLSSPKLLTLDNVEAVMENISTFFVKVEGNQDASLFDVSVGTALRVTPLIVDSTNGEPQQVKLAIRIEDGSISTQSVEGVPVIQRSTITTQSFIQDGQALLIAGYTQESKGSEESGVPGLSSMPVVGRLFKYTNKSNKRVERLFLLTPKVVTL